MYTAAPFALQAGMNRRDFMKCLPLTALAVALPGCAAETAAPLALPGMGESVRVSLAGLGKGSPDTAVGEAVRKAAEEITDFSWLSRGDTVLIKPALNSSHPYPATTSPAGLGAMIRLLKEHGAGKVLVSDMSGIEHVKLSPDRLKGSSRQLMIKSGMAEAAESEGAELYFPEEDGWDAFYEDGPECESHWKAGIMMPKILREVDHIVLMPRCGRHVLLGSTLGMKTAVGYWRTDSRLEYHQYAATLQEKTAEANMVSVLREKQRLVLTTATHILSTFGPDKGHVIAPDTGLIMASESVVAHDMVSLAWLLENRKSLPDSERVFFRDPYTVEAIVRLGNRIVVHWLGGPGKAFSAEKLTRPPIETIWDDRVLNRAYQLLGGVPHVELVDVDDSVPSPVKQTLQYMTTKPL